MNIAEIIDALEGAPRRGTAVDEPEGARYVVFSDTAIKGSRGNYALQRPRGPTQNFLAAQMNLLDKAINFVAPRAALRRARSRVALELTNSYLARHAERFRYDAATAGRRAYGWYAASTDANVELMGSLIWLRNRSRDLVRNNPYAARAIEELAGNVVGTGIVPKDSQGYLKSLRMGAFSDQRSAFSF